MLIPVPEHPWVAWYLARLITLQRYLAGPSAIQAWCDEIFGGTTTVTTFPAQTMQPMTIVAHRNGQSVITLGGLPSAQAADRLMGGYSERTNLRAERGVNRALNVSADIAFQQWNDFGGAVVREVYIAGYSYGAAEAFVLAAKIRAARPNAIISVCAFGGPRPADDRLRAHLNGVRIGRFMNLGDPVPLIPPQEGEDNAPISLNRLLTWGNSTDFVHPSDGIILSQGDPYVVADTGAILPDGFNLSVIGWATATLMNPTTEHQIITYEARLATWKTTVRQPGALASPQATPTFRGDQLILSDARVPIPARDMAHLPPAGNATVNVLPATPTLPATPEWLIRQRQARTKGVYYAEKILGKWYVSTGGDQLWQLRSRREAKQTAARLNRMLVTFDRSPYQNEEAFEQSVIRNFNT